MAMTTNDQAAAGAAALGAFGAMASSILMAHALLHCWASDKTRLDYGEVRPMDGKKPAKGERWLDPRERAFYTLKAFGVNPFDAIKKVG